MAAMSEAEYKALAGRAYAALKKYPNVHSVGIGGRERKGRPTGDIVIKVFVSAKRNPGELAPSEVIPADFEGVPTDVVEAPEPGHDLLQLIPGFLFDDSNDDDAKYRPLKGGIQIAGANDIGQGTLGFLAKVQGDNRIMAVTNYHVLFDSQHLPKPGLRVGNPDAGESCTKCCIGAFGQSVAAHRDPQVDIAISSLDPKTEWLAEIQCIGAVKGFHPLTVPETALLDYNIRKYGRTTRLTGGTVQSLNVHGSAGGEHNPPRNYTNAISVKPNPMSSGSVVRFSAAGDSGAAYVNDANEIVGLHFSGNKDKGQPDTGWGWGIPVADIVNSLQTNDHITLIPAIGAHVGDVQQATAAADDLQAPIQPAAEAEAMARRLETDLSRSERGRLMTALWLRHSSELNRLVNGNRKVGALWRRNSGPAIFQQAIRLAEVPEAAIPETIDGRSVDQCVLNIFDVFARYGSEPLQADLRAHRAVLPPLGGRSYQEILATLTGQSELF
jgi:hypothetical protein